MPNHGSLGYLPTVARSNFRSAKSSRGQPRNPRVLSSKPLALSTLSCRTARCAHEIAYFDLPWSVQSLYIVARSFYLRSAILPCSHVFTRLTVHPPVPSTVCAAFTPRRHRGIGAIRTSLFCHPPDDRRAIRVPLAQASTCFPVRPPYIVRTGQP